MIKVITFYSSTDEYLEEKLNEIDGQIINIEHIAENEYKIIYQSNDN